MSVLDADVDAAQRLGSDFVSWLPSWSHVHIANSVPVKVRRSEHCMDDDLI